MREPTTGPTAYHLSWLLGLDFFFTLSLKYLNMDIVFSFDDFALLLFLLLAETPLDGGLHHAAVRVVFPRIIVHVHCEPIVQIIYNCVLAVR